MKASLLSLLALAVVLGAANAQRGSHLLTNIPKELPGVTVYHMFTNAQHMHQMHGGDEVDVVLTVHNEYTAPINVTYISGSINSPDDTRIYVQNFTQMEHKAPVQSGQDRSFVYKFTPNRNLPSRGFSIALTVFYEDLSNDISGSHATTFFNKTVEVLEPPRWVDTEAISMYLTLAIIVAGLGYSLFSFLEGFPAFKAWFKRTKKAKRTMTADAPPGDRSDYLVGTPHYLSQLKKQKAEAEKQKKAT